MSVCCASLPLFRQVRRVIGFRDVWLTRNVVAASFNGLYHLRGRSLANSLRFHKVTGTTRKTMRL